MTAHAYPHYEIEGAEHEKKVIRPEHHADHLVRTFQVDHATYPELSHKYDHQHDVEPIHFHEHSILQSRTPEGSKRGDKTAFPEEIM